MAVVWLIFAGVLVYNVYTFAKTSKRLQEDHERIVEVLQQISSKLEKIGEGGK